MVNSVVQPSAIDSVPPPMDLSPLAWVQDETRKSLSGVGKALKRYAQEAEHARGVDLEALDATPLRLSRQHLHQVGGALEMVGQSVAARMVQAMEGAVQRFVADPEACTVAAAQTIEKAGFALQEYIEEQLQNNPRPALGLFSQYQQVQALAGAGRIHPSDLWDRSWSWHQPQMPEISQALTYEDKVRKRLDHSVLQVMKHGDVHAAGELSTLCHGLSAGVEDERQSAFWAVASGFFEAVEQGLVILDRFAKGSASRTLLQYAGLARGETRISERLAHDLLFYCSQAVPDSVQAAPRLSAVREAWQLHLQTVVDYHRPMFGLHDPAALEQARRRIESAKENWSALAGGELNRLKTCADQFSLVRASLDSLYPQGQPLGQALQSLMGGVQKAARVPSPELAIEVATAVLFLEASLTDFRPDDPAFGERAQELADRLGQVSQGVSAAPLAPWMEELYRRVSDRQTMGTVVGELRVTLDEVEQKLDRFSRAPDDPSALEPVPALMGQMRGVLSVLGLDQASLAVGRMREQVEELLQQGPEPDLGWVAARFEKLGNSLGALGFLLDTLGYQPTLARKLFFYDEEMQEFRYVAGRSAEARRLGQMEATATTARGHEPDEFVSEQLAELDRLPSGPAALEPLSEPAAQNDRTPATELADEEVDDELLDIFLEEAREVVADGMQAIEVLEQVPADEENLTILRRSFHTLKGSSRMVGLSDYGEAAWSLEQLLNAWMAEHRPADDDLCAVAGQGLQALGQWADDLAEGQDRGWMAEPFQILAGGLRVDGQRLELELLPASAVELDARIAPEAEPSVAGDAIAMDLDEPTAEIELPAEAADLLADPQPAASQEAVVDAVPVFDLSNMDLPDLELPLEEALDADTLQSVDLEAGDTTQSLELSDAELAALVEGLDVASTHSQTVPLDGSAVSDAGPEFELDLEFALDDGADTVPAATLPEEDRGQTGDAADAPVTEAPALAELDLSALEAESSDVAETPADSAEAEEPLAVAEAGASDGPSVRQVGDLVLSDALYNVFLGEAETWSSQLQSDLAGWAEDPQDPVPERAIARAHSLGGSSATVGFSDLSNMARGVEHALLRLQAQDSGTADQAQVLCAAADEIRNVLHRFAAGVLKSPSPELLQAVRQLEPEPPLVAEDQGPGEPMESGPELLVSAELATAVVAPALVPLLDEDSNVEDVIDPDLFPIFEEEAEELLPELSAALRRWVEQPNVLDARAQALRVLHTLKGSARLAGALRLGELAHQTESAIEILGAEDLNASDLEPLLEALDRIESDFERLQASGVERTWQPEPVVSEPQPQPVADHEISQPQLPQQPVAAEGQVAEPVALSLVSARASARQMVRVRAQLLDRLLVQAGEIMTGRARMEADMVRLRTSLTELGGNVERLRNQLRDVELQAETQMQSRLAQSRDIQQSFDPLEFDRFTRMQELARMMAESVNDVATVQRNLQRVIESSEDELAAQGRQSRGLQDDLLRTRMMEFDGIAERLYRVVRQASKETGKQVRMDLLGGGIEIDRGILDRMTPVFEHLLRNSVVHGIETPEERSARSKDAVGQITVRLEQQGNDVAVEFHDDGGGLDLIRIREQARATGLLAEDEELDDEGLAQLILAPGFTTAPDLTGLAGRGVGMDVVRTEIQSLGGRIEIHSETGKGAAFRLVLPLTTAVTQVVLLRVDELVIGVPANLVDIVVRSNESELEQAYADQAFAHDGESLPFFWGGGLLQHSAHSRERDLHIRPVVMLRSADQRIALHVDEVLGSQEVVVKALGPQLSRLPGLVAVTALASGAVTLIYNPVALATVYGRQVHAFGMARPGEELGAPARQAADSDIPLVLVVDDSITVRRVTQRMLQREGYRVALAADGLAGLAELGEERPALVLSDIEMPRMDGFEFLRNIRADEAHADLPVVMITSRMGEKHREHARQLGANHYLGKPYSEDELLTLVHTYARAARAEPVI